MPRIGERRRWRPRLSMVIGVIVLLLITLPVAGLLTVRLADNQFVRETERSLIAQAALAAEVYAEMLPTEVVLAARRVAEPERARLAERYHPVEPSLVATEAQILEPAPDGPALSHPPLAAYEQIRSRLSALAVRAQKTTLAGYRFTDASGEIVAASGDGIGSSLLHLREVRAALEGRTASTLRYRKPQDERHALSSISRDTTYRVNVAHPVIRDGRLLGAVYLSRTPIDLRKFLYRERNDLAFIVAIMVAGALVTGVLLWRLISRPLLELRDQSRAVASGARSMPEPLDHYGVAELYDLGQSVLSMARSLNARSDAIRTYTDHVTHELKSPVTTIVGASELLQTSRERLEPERRDRLLETIHAEGLRMDALLAKLRELARIQSLSTSESSRLSEGVDRMKSEFPNLDVTLSGHDTVALTPEERDIVLKHLFQNAAEHGATRIELTSEPHVLSVEDDGTGISEANRENVFQPFFTTKRQQGGTGMGLSIVAAIATRRGGEISLGDRRDGATFRIRFTNGS